MSIPNTKIQGEALGFRLRALGFGFSGNPDWDCDEVFADLGDGHHSLLRLQLVSVVDGRVIK